MIITNLPPLSHTSTLDMNRLEIYPQITRRVPRTRQQRTRARRRESFIDRIVLIPRVRRHDRLAALGIRVALRHRARVRNQQVVAVGQRVRLPGIGADALVQGRAAGAVDDDQRAVGVYGALCVPPWIHRAGRADGPVRVFGLWEVAVLNEVDAADGRGRGGGCFCGNDRGCAVDGCEGGYRGSLRGGGGGDGDIDDCCAGDCCECCDVHDFGGESHYFGAHVNGRSCGEVILG